MISTFVLYVDYMYVRPIFLGNKCRQRMAKAFYMNVMKHTSTASTFHLLRACDLTHVLCSILQRAPFPFFFLFTPVVL